MVTASNNIFVGNLVKILLYTKVSKYLEWKCVDGSYVYQFRKGGIFSSDKAAIYKVTTNREIRHRFQLLTQKLSSPI